VLFERGAFSGHDAAQSGLALAAYSAGLPAYVLVKLTNTAFYAHENTKTPVQTALISLVVGLVMMGVLMHPFGHTGLAAATSIAAWVNLGLQFILLRQKNILEKTSAFVFMQYAAKALAMAAVMGGYIVLVKLYVPLDTAGSHPVVWLGGVIATAGALWGGVGYLLGLHRLLFTFALPKK